MKGSRLSGCSGYVTLLSSSLRLPLSVRPDVRSSHSKALAVLVTLLPLLWHFLPFRASPLFFSIFLSSLFLFHTINLRFRYRAFWFLSLFSCLFSILFLAFASFFVACRLIFAQTRRDARRGALSSHTYLALFCRFICTVSSVCVRQLPAVYLLSCAEPILLSVSVWILHQTWPVLILILWSSASIQSIHHSLSPARFSFCPFTRVYFVCKFRMLLRIPAFFQSQPQVSEIIQP